MKEIIIEENELRRIAIKEDGILTECHIETKEEKILPGNLILGVIKNTVFNMSSVFIDIGDTKNAYLYVEDKKVLGDYKAGQGILVEVLKERAGSKGAKVTDRISIAGKYVILYLGSGFSYSRKIDPRAFVEQHGNLKPVKGYRILFREASMEADLKEIYREVDELKAEFDKALMKAETGIGPRKLYGDESLLDRIIRDNFKDLKLVYTDSKRIQDHLKQEYGLPALLHQDEQNIFDFYGVEKELLKLRHDRVSLPGGGNIVIERTEAMYVVDVNSAKRSGPKANEETVLEINMQAAREAARQIRLRNMAGIILIDFIDMESQEHNDALLHFMEKEMAKDSLKNTVYPVTELGLMQVARRSKGYPISKYLFEDCRTCHGQGQVLSFDYIRRLIRNEIRREARAVSVADFHIELNQRYEERVLGNKLEFLRDIDALDKRIYVTYSQTNEPFIIEPLIFSNQIREKEIYLLNI